VNYIKTLHDQVNAMLKGLVQQLPSMAIAVAILVVTWFLARFAVRIADRLTRNTHMRENLKQLVETVVRLVIWVAGLMIAATVAVPGITAGSVLAGLGVSALAIGFAFQDIFQNFLAGVLIMLRDKMKIGDNIECEGITGKVERITLRETHIRAPSNELTIVPNSVLFKNPVKVTTDRPDRRFQIVVGIVSSHDLDEASRVIRKAVEAVKDVDQSHPVDVFAREFKDGSVDFLVRWWSGARPKDFTIQDEVVRGIKRALDSAGMDISGADPTTIVIERPDNTPAAPPLEPRPRREIEHV
jgi:small-conductance mechanosensitive channel